VRSALKSASGAKPKMFLGTPPCASAKRLMKADLRVVRYPKPTPAPKLPPPACNKKLLRNV